MFYKINLWDEAYETYAKSLSFGMALLLKIYQGYYGEKDANSGGEKKKN